MKHQQRPLSLTSPGLSGFSTMFTDRPALAKAASDSNLKPDEDDSSGGGQVDGSNGSGNLNREVAALSNKLISAINHQTKLDDSLSATKHELELSKARIRQLEAVAKEHADMMAKGLLVERKEVESETQQLIKRLQEESMYRGQAEKDKKHIEQELENLTTALFDEANKMVSAARKERDTMDRKNEQLKAQLVDTETLLASHQEQLTELKTVMQQMTKEREESEGLSTGTPSTPATSSHHRGSKDSLGRLFESLQMVPNSASIEEFPPCPPTSLINLVHPVLRHDTSAYREFCDVLQATKIDSKPPTPSPGRLSGGSFTSLQVIGMGIAVASPQQSSLGGGLFGMRKRVDSGSTTHSPSGSTSSLQEAQAHLATLKETKFYKRVMVEDIEPTLRLDTAPGLSWLARRNVMSSITDGSLVIDPMPTSTKVNMFACALCGESKPDEQHARTHRMRTSDNPNAQRYPLCWYCTNRLRGVCDFMQFLRTLKEGLWKCESEGDQKHAWEESVKLRERMFWARVGGGVVPAFIHQSTRDSTGDQARQTETPPRTPVISGINETPTKLDIPKKRGSRNDPYLTPEKQTGVEILPLPLPSPLNLSLDGNEPGPEKEGVSNEKADAVQTETKEITTAEPMPFEIPLPESPRVSRRDTIPISPLTKVNPDIKFEPLTADAPAQTELKHQTSEAETSKAELREPDEFIRPSTADRPIPGGW